MAKKIIIDTDPGQDDAVAILLALASPELDVLGITTVAGNVPLSLTSLNARKIRELAGRGDVPVFAGCDRPLRRPLVTAEYVHGTTGLDGADLADPVLPLEDTHAVDFIVEAVLEADPGTITICPLGPLTNLATAMGRSPEIAGRIGEVVLMGGAYFEGGNVTPAAEFNVFVDPEAADIVFTSGVPLTVHPLDVTHKALITPSRLAEFGSIATEVGSAVHGLLEFFERYDVEKYGGEGGPLHDPCVIAYLLEPALFTGKDCYVAIEVESDLTRGMTVVDWWGITGNAPNCRYIHDVDAPAFFSLLVERIGRL